MAFGGVTSEPAVKGVLTGLGVGIGLPYVADFYFPKYPAVAWVPMHIEPLMYGGALLLIALGLVSKQHGPLAITGVSLAGGFWIYQHYLLQYFLRRKSFANNPGLSDAMRLQRCVLQGGCQGNETNVGPTHGEPFSPGPGFGPF